MNMKRKLILIYYFLKKKTQANYNHKHTVQSHGTDSKQGTIVPGSQLSPTRRPVKGRAVSASVGLHPHPLHIFLKYMTNN